MKPGRELDALIAEKVFGNSVFSISSTADYGLQEGRPDGAIRTLANYSTDIAAAWEVVKEVTSKATEGSGTEYLFTLTSNGLKSEAIFLDVFVGSPADPGNWPHHSATADTAPHAICLAALKAIGELE